MLKSYVKFRNLSSDLKFMASGSGVLVIRQALLKMHEFLKSLNFICYWALRGQSINTKNEKFAFFDCSRVF